MKLVGSFHGNEFKGCVHFANGDIYEGEMTFNITKFGQGRFNCFTLAYAKGKAGMFQDRESGKTVPCSVSEDGSYENGLFRDVSFWPSQDKQVKFAKGAPPISALIGKNLRDFTPVGYYEKVQMKDGVPVADGQSDQLQINHLSLLEGASVLNGVHSFDYYPCKAMCQFTGQVKDDNDVRKLTGRFTSKDTFGRPIVVEGTCRIDGLTLVFENASIKQCKRFSDEWMEITVVDNKAIAEKPISDPAVTHALNEAKAAGARQSK